MKYFFYLSFFLLFACNNSSSTQSTTDTPKTPNKEAKEISESPSNSAPTPPSTPEAPSPQPASSTLSLSTPFPEWPVEAKRPFSPFDEAVKDPKLVKFRARLWKATLEKDLDFILGILDEHIKFSFGAENGKEAFIANWKLNLDPKGSEFWREMRDILMLGGAFSNDNNGFSAPYVATLSTLEPYEDGVITGAYVRVREKPNSQSTIVATLSWEKVKVMYEEDATAEVIAGERYYWVPVEFRNGKQGFVFGKYLRTNTGYRLFLEKQDSGWKLVSFIAGD